MVIYIRDQLIDKIALEAAGADPFGAVRQFGVFEIDQQAGNPEIVAGNAGANQDHSPNLPGLVEFKVNIHDATPTARAILVQIYPFPLVAAKKVKHRITLGLVVG
jgi:hypothetical protein